MRVAGRGCRALWAALPLDVAVDLAGDLRIVSGDGDRNPVVDLGPLEFQLASLAGDLDADGDVDFADLLALLAAWGDCSGAESCQADLNRDGGVRFADLLILLASWG